MQCTILVEEYRQATIGEYSSLVKQTARRESNVQAHTLAMCIKCAKLPGGDVLIRAQAGVFIARTGTAKSAFKARSCLTICMFELPQPKLQSIDRELDDSIHGITAAATRSPLVRPGLSAAR